jgi:hypothetical protein
MAQPIQSVGFPDKFEFVRALSGVWGWRSEKEEEIDGHTARVYDVKNVRMRMVGSVMLALFSFRSLSIITRLAFATKDSLFIPFFLPYFTLPGHADGALDRRRNSSA